MNLDASNKLLKIIEELPSGTVFLFVSKQPEKLIDFIKASKNKNQNFYFEEIKWFKGHERKNKYKLSGKFNKGNVGKIKK